MKTAQDPRHQLRIDRMQKLFAASFHNPDEDPEIEPIISHISDIDRKIHDAAPEWPIDKIAKTDLAILRLAVFELAIESKIPPKVVIDEAVELAKSYGNPNSPGFINGALGTILKKTEELNTQK